MNDFSDLLGRWPGQAGQKKERKSNNSFEQYD